MVRTISRRSAVLFLAVCAGLGAVSAGPAGGPPAGDESRASAVCLGCHEGRDSTLAGTAHWSGQAHDGAASRVACTDCHPGDRGHWEDDPAAHPMTNPAEVNAAVAARLCSTCHLTAHQQNMREKNAHLTANVGCTGCHSVHGSRHESLLRAAEPGLCYGCHAGVEGEFAKPYRHPVADGVVTCSECHLTLDRARRGLSRNGTNEVCVRCHGEMAGPFPHEHPATLDHSTDEGGCLSCHDPHGSALPRMLKQPYEPPHFPLCTQCHSVPRHFANAMHGTSFAGVPCNQCHIDLHGSYDNRLFVSEALRSQGCFTGCHQL